MKLKTVLTTTSLLCLIFLIVLLIAIGMGDFCFIVTPWSLIEIPWSNLNCGIPLTDFVTPIE